MLLEANQLQNLSVYKIKMITIHFIKKYGKYTWKVMGSEKEIFNFLTIEDNCDVIK